MIDRFRDLIARQLGYDIIQTDELLNIGKSMERYMWMDAEEKLKEKEKKDEG